MLIWPKPSWRKMARERVDGCYGSQFDVVECGSVLGLFDEATKKWGTVRSYRIVAVGQNVFNHRYKVVVEADRGYGPTTEELDVMAGDAERIGHGLWAHIKNLNIRRR